MMDMVRKWWGGRSQREQRMLLVMFFLIAIVILWLGILRPVNDGLSRARDRHAQAVLTHADVLAKREAVRALLKAGAAPLGAPVETVVRESAGEAGFNFDALNAESSDRLTLTIASARPKALFAWLAALEARGVLVERLQVRDNADPTLNVQLTLRGRTS